MHGHDYLNLRMKKGSLISLAEWQFMQLYFQRQNNLYQILLKKTYCVAVVQQVNYLDLLTGNRWNAGRQHVVDSCYLFSHGCCVLCGMCVGHQFL